MKDVIVIGVDHGYAAMKTVHFSFPTGLVEYEHEPYTQKDVLEYNGRYYVVGSGRQPLQRDKTQTEATAAWARARSSSSGTSFTPPRSRQARSTCSST